VQHIQATGTALNRQPALLAARSASSQRAIFVITIARSARRRLAQAKIILISRHHHSAGTA